MTSRLDEIRARWAVRDDWGYEREERAAAAVDDIAWLLAEVARGDRFHKAVADAIGMVDGEAWGPQNVASHEELLPVLREKLRHADAVCPTCETHINAVMELSERVRRLELALDAVIAGPSRSAAACVAALDVLRGTETDEDVRVLEEVSRG